MSRPLDPIGATGALTQHEMLAADVATLRTNLERTCVLLAEAIHRIADLEARIAKLEAKRDK